ARVGIAFIPRQSPHHNLVKPTLGEHSNAIEALLAVHRQVVDELFEGRRREGFVAGFDLLEAGDVRARLLKPGEGPLEPGLGAVDVPGCAFKTPMHTRARAVRRGAPRGTGEGL